MKTEIINKMGITGVKFELCIFELQALANLNKNIENEIDKINKKHMYHKLTGFIDNINKIINFNARIIGDIPTVNEVEDGLFSPVIKDNI